MLNPVPINREHLNNIKESFFFFLKNPLLFLLLNFKTTRKTQDTILRVQNQSQATLASHVDTAPTVLNKIFFYINIIYTSRKFIYYNH